MARIIVLDSKPLGLACDDPAKRAVRGITRWWSEAIYAGALVVIPEVADFEVRRELLRISATPSIVRLDRLRASLRYVPITTASMRRAAALWADVRRRGLPTADNLRLDADCILAAQALEFSGLGDAMTIATHNVAHIGRLVEDARPWDRI